jgi:type VI secretion system protein ImpL
MLKLLYKALKILIGVILLAALAFGLWLLTERQGWPWWVALALFLGLLGLILAGMFLKKWLLRRREKKFVQRIVEQDESVMLKKPMGERQELLDLDERWRIAVSLLKRSHLKKFGDPVYALPWYLMLGESGSGKSTALRNSRLRSPMTDVSPAPGSKSTLSCDWWFFDDTVILDTAGRYSIPLDQVPDQEEWQRFLNLLIKYRRKEPINGIVLTVGADRLIQANEDEISDLGRQLRRRIDEVMLAMGARLPIYVLVTKIDCIVGLTDYMDLLPEDVLEQVVGVGNPQMRHEPRLFAERTLDEVRERFKDLRLLTLNSDEHESRDLGLMVFPDELDVLKPNLTRFMEIAFERNPYQETPILRGIYFCSARQTGQAESLIYKAKQQLPLPTQKLPDSEVGVFIKELFSKILPRDRALASPLKVFLSWKRMTKSLGLSAWALLFLCLCGVLTLSLVKNTQTIRAFTDDLPNVPQLTGQLQNDLLQMYNFQTELTEMTSLNHHWWIPRMGLYQSLEAEKDLRELFCRMFDKGVLYSIDESLAKNIHSSTANNSGQVIGSFVEHLEKRVNLLQARLKGMSSSDLAKQPLPSPAAMLAMDPTMLQSVATSFGSLYLSYVEWNPNHMALVREVQILQGLLETLARTRANDLSWLVDWANAQPDITPITLGDFWGQGRLINPSQIQVPAAFTLAGRKKIDDLLKDYKKALPDPSPVTRKESDFNVWYWNRYIKAWEDFGLNFDQGYIRLASDDDRRTVAAVMATSNNPYFILLDRMDEQLKPVAKQTDLPQWVQGVYFFKKVSSQAAQNKVIDAGGTLLNLAQKSENVIRKTVKTPVTDDTKGITGLEDTIKAAEQLANYEKALGDIVAATSSEQAALKMISTAFASAGQDEKAPFQQAHVALLQIRNANMTAISQNDLFWRLVSGPFYYLLAFTTHEAACQLQVIWEGDVLAASQDVPPQKLRTTLFDPDKGLVWKFVNNDAAAFLGRDMQGFFAQKLLNQPFPFTSSFLAFLDMGSSQSQMILPEYDVTMKTRPLTVNSNAILEPYATVMILDCGSGPQTLDNYNYPNNLTFKWKPDQCGDVTLQIKFDDFTLTKMYKGVEGFPTFLETFRDGTVTFTPDDFPEFKDNLKNVRVNQIRVTYVIDGDMPVRKLLQRKGFQVPPEIVICHTSP